MTVHVAMTPQVVSDINSMAGSTYEAALLNQHIGSCFTQIDFDFFDKRNNVYPCRGCRVQIACAIYRAERAGIQGVRDRFLTGLVKPADGTPYPVPPELYDAIMAIKQAKAAPPPPPPPTAPEAEAAPAPEAVGTAPPLVPPSAPMPDAIMAAASAVSVAGGPPEGWRAFDRDQLAKLCLALGYTEQDLFKKRQTTLITLIEKKKPEWCEAPAPAAPTIEPPPPVPVEDEPPEAVEPAPAPTPVPAAPPTKKADAPKAAPPKAAPLAVEPAEVEPAEVEREHTGPLIAAVRVQGRAEEVADMIAEMFGDRIVEAHVVGKDAA